MTVIAITKHPETLSMTTEAEFEASVLARALDLDRGRADIWEAFGRSRRDAEARV